MSWAMVIAITGMVIFLIFIGVFDNIDFDDFFK